MIKLPRNIIIDCDPGCDDAVALAAALTYKGFNIVGITSIGGNVIPEITQRNAIGITHLIGRTDVPVIAGAKKPLIKKPVFAPDVHGESGVDGLTMDFAAIAKLEEQQPKISAVDFILEQSHKYNGTLELIVIGPMTNIAMAFQKNPTIVNRINSVTVMGGAFGNPTGNIGDYDNQAEFNAFCDPHAAKLVYDNFKNITVMPLDVTHQTLQDDYTRGEIARISELGANYARMLNHYAHDYPGMKVQGTSPLHDFHTVAALINPRMYEFTRGRVSIGTEGATEGATKLNPDAHGNARVALNVNQNQFWNFLRTHMMRALG